MSINDSDLQAKAQTLQSLHERLGTAKQFIGELDFRVVKTGPRFVLKYTREYPEGRGVQLGTTSGKSGELLDHQIHALQIALGL